MYLMKRLETFNQHIQKSAKLSCVVSFFAGSILKILIVLLVVIYYSLQGGGGVTIEGLKISYPSGIETPPSRKYFSALIAAPIIENLTLPLTVWLVDKLKAPILLGFFCLGGLMYFAHAQGNGSISGGIAAIVLFTFILAQYLVASKTHGKRNAYWFTVLTHFAYNLTTFAFIHILNLMVLYL